MSAELAMSLGSSNDLTNSETGSNTTGNAEDNVDFSLVDDDLDDNNDDDDDDDDELTGGNQSHDDYLKGLDNMRKIIAGIVADVDQIETIYYACADSDRVPYMTSVEKSFAHSMARLNDSSDLPDSDVMLMSLLNRLREIADDNDADFEVSLLTEFCRRLREAMDALNATKERFESRVMCRLPSGFGVSGSKNSTHNKQQVGFVENRGNCREPELVQLYRAKCFNFKDTIAHALTSIAECHANYMRAPTVEISSLDINASPVLKLFPIAHAHMLSAVNAARTWIDADETYMHDIGACIGTTRRCTRRLERRLAARRERRAQLEGKVRDAHDLFRDNQQALALIVQELGDLEVEVDKCAQSQRRLADEQRQKQGIVGFLEIGLAQMKQRPRECGLQLKRSRLARQLRELEDTMPMLEQQIASLDAQINATMERKCAASERVRYSDISYKKLKENLDSFNEHVQQLHEEVNDLSNSLSQLESIQTIKMSPENVEDFYERPSTVKLAPSLKEKILRKRKESDYV